MIESEGPLTPRTNTRPGGRRVAAAARAFATAGEFQDVERYGSGHIHDTYLARFETGGRAECIILQRINTRIFKDPVGVMRNIERVTAHLQLQLNGVADRDRRVLRLVPAHDGDALHVDAERQYWRAYRFIAGARTYDAVSSPQQAFEAAKAFGVFQAQLVDLPGPRLEESIPEFHNTQKRYAALERAIVVDVAHRCEEARSEVAIAESRMRLAAALAEAGLPERVTHNDTKLNNVMLDDATGEGICVIDLDTVMPGVAAFDFGDMVRTMTCAAAEDEKDLSRVGMDFALFEAVLRGYVDGAGSFLTEAERESLIAGAKVIVFEQGIRFLADFLAGDTYYKVTRPEQNLDRCRTQFRLLQSIEEQEGAMARLLRSVG
jgi:hypothetical protein